MNKLVDIGFGVFEGPGSPWTTRAQVDTRQGIKQESDADFIKSKLTGFPGKTKSNDETLDRFFTDLKTRWQQSSRGTKRTKSESSRGMMAKLENLRKAGKGDSDEARQLRDQIDDIDLVVSETVKEMRQRGRNALTKAGKAAYFKRYFEND